jgi:hypothetical protein
MQMLWQIVTVVYNLFFHPLRKFPGPLLQRASAIPWAVQLVSGVQALRTQQLHAKYGNVVRIGPNHLSFTDPAAWKDIYGHKSADMEKSHVFFRTLSHFPTREFASSTTRGNLPNNQPCH